MHENIAATGHLADVSADLPHLPKMITRDGQWVPAAPAAIAETGVSASLLLDLALRYAAAVPEFTTESAARELHLPQALTGELAERLRADRFLETLGTAGPLGYRYNISDPGRARAARLGEVSGYVGPAPVSLPAYRAFLEWQRRRFPPVSPAMVREAIADLVLPSEAVEVAGLAVSSGRSLFVFGPPGNGKSTLGKSLHRVLGGTVWVPHSIAVGDNIIRVFDPQVHEPAGREVVPEWQTDRRWIQVRRPLILVDAEATIESFDLTYIPSRRYYEAPLQLKANGGLLFVDDFGRQRVPAEQFFNRWIIPLENHFDYLTMKTGQKIMVPIHELMIVATNLRLEKVTDAAFLRRMGYRLRLNKPTADQYAAIFKRCAARYEVTIPPGLMEWLFRQYDTEGHEFRGCEPGDLLARVADICRFRNEPMRLTEDLLATAWMGYFGGISKG